MYESKLTQIFIKFSLEEKRRIRKWIISDFVNKNQDITHLFKFLDSRTIINENTVTKEKAFAYVYGKSDFNDLKMRHLIWMATEVLESFIIYNNINSHVSLHQQILAGYYHDKQLYKYANQYLEDGIREIEGQKKNNTDYYLNLFRLQSQAFLINSRNIQDQKFHLDDIMHASSAFFLIELLKHACISQSFQKSSEASVNHFLLNHVMLALPASEYIDLPQVHIYYRLNTINTIENVNDFHELLQFIRKNEYLFSAHDLNDIYRLSINFCIKKTNENKSEYTQEAFELYLYAVEKGYLLLHNEISRFIFTNIIALGIKLKAFDKTEKFMQQYAAFIDEAYRQNTIDFNNARIMYSKQQYTKALTLLLTNEFKDTILNLNAKYLTLKILFELNDFTLFNTQLKAFSIYIKRKSNIGYHKDYFTNVAKSLATLADIYKKPNKYADFKFSDATPDKDWFNTALEKIPVSK